MLIWSLIDAKWCGEPSQRPGTAPNFQPSEPPITAFGAAVLPCAAVLLHRAVSGLIVRSRTLYLLPCVQLCSILSDGSLRLPHGRITTGWLCLLARLPETSVCVTDSAIRVAYRDSEVSTRGFAGLCLLVSVSCAKWCHVVQAEVTVKHVYYLINDIQTIRVS